MRNTFIETLCEIAAQDERIFLLCGDLGFSVLESFSSRYPERFINVGVAEQNMTGVAAGLAMCGKTVFTYSIANFPVVRCLEQIRNDVCYHNANVKIVAVGGGVAYGPQGYSHQGVEDLAMTRVLPNMTVLAPGDPMETRLGTRVLSSVPGPAYLRLGKANEPKIHQSEPKFELGKSIEMLTGKDLTIITTGGVLQLGMQAAEQLRASGIDTGLLSMPFVQPLDEEAILRAAQETRRIITVEEHGLGGLAAGVAEALATSDIPCGFRAIRFGRAPLTEAGSQNYLREQGGVSIRKIMEAGKKLTNQPPRL
jgi:transketolase